MDRVSEVGGNAMKRILITHLSGSKTGQKEEFPLEDLEKLTFGRDPSSSIQYDPEKDDLVSRQHAAILQEPGDEDRFFLEDLDSSNGTFLNKARIANKTAIRPGDKVQLGPGGPEFEFNVEPPIAPKVAATRVASALGADGRDDVPATTVSPAAKVDAPSSSRPSLGKATVERMIGKSSAESRKNLLYGGAALVILIAIVAAVLIYQNISSRAELSGELAGRLDDFAAEAPMSPSQIAEANLNTVVYIECGWKLIYTRTGGQVYHSYYPNEFKDQEGKTRPLIDDGRSQVALYLAVSQERIEPFLTLDSESGQPIGGEHTGSGFTVTSDGFVLTNRHVAAAWRTAYRFSGDAREGILVSSDGEIMTREDGSPIMVQAPTDWVPYRSRQAGQQLQGGFEGRNDYLDLTFAKQQLRFPAQLARISDRHDVALLKIQVAEPVAKVALNDNYSTIRPGDTALIMGYPGVSPGVYGVVESRDVFDRNRGVRVIPDPTVTMSYVGRILRAGSEQSSPEMAIFSEFGDAYQLTANATGSGNSGGPVFDEVGRVVGIYFAGRRTDAMVSFAVPIRYGMELMTSRQVIQ